MTAFTVCIPAAGSGTRMNSSTPKQYLPLLGRAVLLQTLDVFLGMKSCTRIVIATDDETTVHNLLGDMLSSGKITIVRGGARRQDSVEHALAAIHGDDDTVVLVHDAARPCVAVDDVRSVAETAALHGAAVLAVQARDTLKEVHGGTVERTLDRDVIWQAQTPQGARASLFRRAFVHAKEQGITATDDVSLIEAMGFPVHVVNGQHNNIKITNPEDIAIAETILRLQGRG
ncbi:MAG: 2-C-methyl-D-erythritol 4-phosphate cytidylyltransferase [Bacteroidetes bacterium]|nr:2-C-methyl-D-erythritol 4-phosphate cytidylyltransferase [Bacteroidota bacterium]